LRPDTSETRINADAGSGFGAPKTARFNPFLFLSIHPGSWVYYTNLFEYAPKMPLCVVSLRISLPLSLRLSILRHVYKHIRTSQQYKPVQTWDAATNESQIFGE
jgi:hypothetical protein